MIWLGLSQLELLEKKKGIYMKLNGKTYRNFTEAEKKEIKNGLEKKLGIKLGRPFMPPEKKRVPVSIKLDPDVLAKFKAKAKKTGRPYQTLINEVLKKAA